MDPLVTASQPPSFASIAACRYSVQINTNALPSATSWVSLFFLFPGNPDLHSLNLLKRFLSLSFFHSSCRFHLYSLLTIVIVEMPSFIKYATAALAAAAPLAAAQTYTDCNPLDKTCPSDAGTTESNLSFDFTQPSGLDQWTTTAGTVNSGPNGAEFTINQRGDAPTIETDFYIFFGEISITMKAAPGQGIISSLVFESDDLDEIDWVRIHL